MPVCKTCIMDSSDSSISFDEDGVCVYCNNFLNVIKPNWHTDNRGFNYLQKQSVKIKMMAEGAISIVLLV